MPLPLLFKEQAATLKAKEALVCVEGKAMTSPVFMVLFSTKQADTSGEKKNREETVQDASEAFAISCPMMIENLLA